MEILSSESAQMTNVSHISSTPFYDAINDKRSFAGLSDIDAIYIFFTNHDFKKNYKATYQLNCSQFAFILVFDGLECKSSNLMFPRRVSKWTF